VPTRRGRGGGHQGEEAVSERREEEVIPRWEGSRWGG
jgi:hypothetical protein